MAAWDETTPASTDLISAGDDAIRQLKTDIRERMDNEHVWTATGANTEGTHAAGFLTNTMVNASAAIGESKFAFNTTTGHRHTGSDSRKVLVTNLDVTGLTVSQLIRTNSGGTALESSGKTVPTGDIVGTSDSQTLTNKTLTTPTIGDFTNATHAHTADSSGGTLNHTNLTNIGSNSHATIDSTISQYGTHTHNSDGGGTVNHTTLSNIGTNTHAQIDTHIASTAQHAQFSGINFIIDGGGSVIATGVKGDIMVPFACTITEATILANLVGAIAIAVWKDTYANFPPDGSDLIDTFSIAASANKSQETGLSLGVSAGDILRFNVNSCTTIERATLHLKVQRT